MKTLIFVLNGFYVAAIQCMSYGEIPIQLVEKYLRCPFIWRSVRQLYNIHTLMNPKSLSGFVPTAVRAVVWSQPFGNERPIETKTSTA
jgi:hypothetical protein